MELSPIFLKIKNHVQLGRDFFLSLLFPIACMSCGLEDYFICPDCLKKIKINQNFSCPICNAANKNGSYCPNCQTKNGLDGLWISADYGNPLLADLIKKLKYSFNKNLLPSLTDLLCHFIELNNLKTLIPEFQKLLLIPVPLHKSRLRSRGFNQSELLAKDLGKRFDLKVEAQKLIRARKTLAQAKLNRNERLANVEGAFAWTGDDLSGTRIILVDDVTSTKATLNNCAKVLKKHGAKEVWGLVLAKN